MSDRHSIGGNQPPVVTEELQETVKIVSGWMAENPVIETEDAARQAKGYLDRMRLGYQDLEDDRKKKVAPLLEQQKAINEEYQKAQFPLETIGTELKERLTAYMRAEEAKRREIAERARREAEEKAQAAQAAIEAEREKLENVDAGEIGVDIVEAAVDTERAIEDAKRAARQAQLAEREQKLRIGGGLGRVSSLRKKETLEIVDHLQAVKAIGWTEDMNEAILKGARAYKRIHNRYPDGVKVTTEEGL